MLQLMWKMTAVRQIYHQRCSWTSRLSRRAQASLHEGSLSCVCTSFVLPDPLTGRTGAEEALHCLHSGYCQPWKHLSPGNLNILVSIADLTPKREYYPRDMKAMQQVFWSPHLTPTIQRDEFRPIVEAICAKSEKLSVFAFKKIEPHSLERSRDPPHLLYRSYSRRRLYQRPIPEVSSRGAAPDLPYDARDRYQASQACLNVFESATLIRNRRAEMPRIPELAGILQAGPLSGVIIAPLISSYSATSLTSNSISIGDHWSTFAATLDPKICIGSCSYSPSCRLAMTLK